MDDVLRVGALYEKDGRLASVKISNSDDGQDDIIEASDKQGFHRHGHSC
jgi:hypothetical protein